MLEELRRDDPLRPVDVVAPSALSGMTLRRSLAEPALANVRFGSLPQLAERLARRAIALQGNRVLTETARTLAVRQALKEGAGPLVEAAAHSATAALLTEVLAELDEAEAEHRLETLAATGSRAAEVARLYAAYRRACACLLTGAQIARVAAEAVRGGTSPETTVVLFAPHRLSAAERELLTALAETGRLRSVVTTTGDPDVDTEAHDIMGWLDELLGPAVEDGPPPTEQVRLTWAPDAEEEVREAVRTVLAYVSEHPARPERIALAYRSSTPYARLVEEQLTVAGLPFHVSGGRRLADSVPGRTLSRLLQLRIDDFARSEVLGWLADAPILTASGAPVPLARWERISRSAGVSRGRDLWHSRLARYAAGVAERRDALAEETLDPAELTSRREGLDRTIAHCDALGSFLDDVVAACDAVAAAATWREVAHELRDALTRFLGEPAVSDRWTSDDDAARWRKVERDALDSVLSAVDRLALLDEVEADAPAYDTVMEALRRELDTVLPSGTTLGRGIGVAPLRDLAGADLDLLVVLGMTEDAFPPRMREHPVLGDGVRETVPGLLTTADRRRTERHSFLAATASARRVVLSAPKADTRAQRALHPSPWFMEAITALNGGQPVPSSELSELNAPWFIRHDSFTAALRDCTSPLSSTELDVQLALAGRADVISAVDHRYARSRLALRARIDGEFGEWTGHVEQLATGPRAKVDRSLSATSLQRYATCPRSFWLKHVLDLHELEDPGEDDVIDSARKGTLVHDVLERFLHETLPHEGPPPRAGRSPDDPWTDAEVARALELFDGAAGDLEAQGVTGRPLLWEAHKARLRRQLRRILQVDSRQRSERRTTPIAVEAPFGRKDKHTGMPVPPLVLDLPHAGHVELAGFIDRVDRAEGGSLVVTDYKTGKGAGYDRIPMVGGISSKEVDLVDRGRKLQLALYGLAARRDFGEETTPVTAYYWFVEQGALHRGGPIDEPVRRRLLDVIDVSVTSARSGVFPAHPGDDAWPSGWESCRFCAFDRVCPTTRAEQWEAVRGTPPVQPYAAVADPLPVIEDQPTEEAAP